MLTRTSTRKHERPRRRPGVVKITFSRFGTPPRQRAPRESKRMYPTVCEDGVDPFATTASAANDDTTADEDDGER
ncbi:hypothetical protein V492_04407 [Pseudogymnoascus sp. VKM F-4246]|nr:hypothetical protein V492_04407 [Pseudogymnoascus sp. VKM F-4246]